MSSNPERAAQCDAALDELLASADEAVLAALRHGLDLDAGRAAVEATAGQVADGLADLFIKLGPPPADTDEEN